MESRKYENLDVQTCATLNELITIKCYQFYKLMLGVLSSLYKISNSEYT